MPVPPTGSDRPRVQRPRRLVSRATFAARRFRDSETLVLLLLMAVGLVCAIVLAEVPDMTTSILLIPMVIGSAVLGPRYLPWFVVYLLAMLVAAIGFTVLQDQKVEAFRQVGISINFFLGGIILLVSFRRSRLGVAGLRGESMLVDLRDRITKQAEIPPLPSDWYAQGVLRSAGGASFAGDFFVATRSRETSRLQVVVVDVSGKGVQAGTRSLLLSGAFGGLLAALPPAKFLPAANDYLLDQDWSEGFATAVHLSLDLVTGDFELRSAGHPPGVQLNAGSGRWVIHETEGPILGLLPDADFKPLTGCLLPGDALLLYTDGLVETPSRDISLGIDRLLGQGERLLRGGFENGARRLIDRIESLNDDRALLLIHRR
ncbi:MAG TPA: PP2C family protein-serine/threonine phosphatase [Nocardioidaceae bacterium]|nr:PP2C family protein-serine/threonine phosphatase [Nocardioidaceae bacterium]